MSNRLTSKKLISDRILIGFIIVIFILVVVVNISDRKDTNTITANNSNSQDVVVEEESNKNRVKYVKCDRLRITDNVKHTLNKFDMKKINMSNLNWELYLPCGYNYVENEIDNIKITSTDQKVFAIKGCDNIASKNNLWKLFVDEYGRSEASRIMPTTYIIMNNEDMSIFKAEYNKNDMYLIKKNIQRKQGIFLSKNYDEIINEIKSDGDYRVIQKYVPDLFTLNNHKINIRLYLVIVCKNDIKTGYIYKEGKCIYSQKVHGDTSKNISSEELNNNEERQKYLTSLNLDVKIYNELPETLNELELYLNQKGSSYSYQMLWENIISIFKKLMIAIENDICTNSPISEITSFQLFGADIIFDNNMDAYLLELNKGPSMKYMTDRDELMKKKLMEDIFKLVGIIDIHSKYQNEFIKL